MSMTGNVIYSVLVASGLTSTAVMQMAPHLRPETADYFEVGSITAERSDNTAILHVERTIKAPLIMSYAVRVFSVSDGLAVMTCAANGGPYLYRPDAALPNPITLKWWTDGECPSIPPGRVQIETTWQPVGPAMAPVSVTTDVRGERP